MNIHDLIILPPNMDMDSKTEANLETDAGQ